MSEFERNNFSFSEDDFSENYLNEIVERCKLILSGELLDESIKYIVTRKYSK